MKRLTVSQLFELYLEVTRENVNVAQARIDDVLDALDELGEAVARALNVRFHGALLGPRGVLADFGPANACDVCPEQLEALDEENVWHEHSGKTALIWCRDVNEILLCCASLVPLGITCLTAGSTEEARSLLAAHDVDLLVTDRALSAEDEEGSLGKLVVLASPQAEASPIATQARCPGLDCVAGLEALGRTVHLGRPVNKTALAKAVARLCDTRPRHQQPRPMLKAS